MLTGPQIVLTLKVLVVAVTVLLIASLVALALKRPRLHGRINTAFFALTMLTVVAFEGLLQFVDVSATFSDEARAALRTHLWFSVPSALVLPFMLATGKMRLKKAHLALSAVFVVLWTGTVITGLGLPH
jgi:FtsH-binding integral membrane protein